MSYPKKNKIIIDTYPITIGNKYMKYGMDRIQELMNLTDEKTKYLPRTILLEDLDLSIYNYINEDNLKLIIDGNSVPVFYMDNDRWGEFIKTWKYYDDDKNVPTPYITINRINKEQGTRLGKKSNVPQLKKFIYTKVPILDENEIIYLLFKMPEPINIDLTYDVTLFTKYRVDINQFDELIFKHFSSIQDYITVKGNPMPIKFIGIKEDNPVSNVDGDKLFICKYTIKLLGFIQNEEDFEITKTYRKNRLGIYV